MAVERIQIQRVVDAMTSCKVEGSYASKFFPHENDLVSFARDHVDLVGRIDCHDGRDWKQEAPAMVYKMSSC